MPSPPETDRAYAYFKASGAGDTSEIEEMIKLKPRDHWNAGDFREIGDRKVKTFVSVWRLDSGLDDTCPLEEHVRALIQKLTPKRTELLSLQTKFDLRIVCVECAYQSAGFELPFNLQRDATQLGIGFSFYGYRFGDIH